jgi:hypothetical protein
MKKAAEYVKLIKVYRVFWRNKIMRRYTFYLSVALLAFGISL